MEKQHSTDDPNSRGSSVAQGGNTLRSIEALKAWGVWLMVPVTVTTIVGLHWIDGTHPLDMIERLFLGANTGYLIFLTFLSVGYFPPIFRWVEQHPNALAIKVGYCSMFMASALTFYVIGP